MSTEVVMPQMGESIAEGTITKWLKKVGERVERDEPLFEISTDKVDAEIPSPAAGTLTEVRFKEGDTVEVNTVVAVLDGDQASARLQHRQRSLSKKPPRQLNHQHRLRHLLQPQQAATTTTAASTPPPPPAEAKPASCACSRAAAAKRWQHCDCRRTAPHQVESTGP